MHLGWSGGEPACGPSVAQDPSRGAFPQVSGLLEGKSTLPLQVIRGPARQGASVRKSASDRRSGPQFIGPLKGIEAVECLQRAAVVDNHARLFLGWSQLLAGLDARDEEGIGSGSAQLSEALRQWAYGNHDPSDRTSWIRQVRRLRALGSRFAEQSRQLLEFANANASWGEIDPAVAEEPWSEDDSHDLLASEDSPPYDGAQTP